MRGSGRRLLMYSRCMARCSLIRILKTSAGLAQYHFLHVSECLGREIQTDRKTPYLNIKIWDCEWGCEDRRQWRIDGRATTWKASPGCCFLLSDPPSSFVPHYNVLLTSQAADRYRLVRVPYLIQRKDKKDQLQPNTSHERLFTYCGPLSSILSLKDN